MVIKENKPFHHLGLVAGMCDEIGISALMESKPGNIPGFPLIGAMSLSFKKLGLPASLGKQKRHSNECLSWAHKDLNNALYIPEISRNSSISLW